MKLTTPFLSASLLILLVAAATAYPEDKDGELYRRKRSSGSKVEKLEKKLLKAQIKEAKKHGHVVVPVAHVPVAHVPVLHHVPVAHVPVVHVSRHRRTPGAVSKLERKIVKAQVKRVAKKEGKKVLSTTRHRRDSDRKKIEKLERKLVKEQIKQARKDSKKGRVAYVPVVHSYPQPVVYSAVKQKTKSPGVFARAKSYLG